MSSREDFHSIDIASAIDDGALRQSLADILHRHAKALTMKRTSSYQEELQTFQQQALEATAAVVVSRDLRLLEAIVNSSGVSAALSHVENARLSPMPAEEWHGLNAEEALTKFADALDQTRQARQFEIMQRLLLEIMAGDRALEESACKNRQARLLALPSAQSLLRACDVQRLATGEALILQPKLDLLSRQRMERVHADLLRLLRTRAVESQSPCNFGSFSTSLTLPHAKEEAQTTAKAAAAAARLVGGEPHGKVRSICDEFDYAPETEDLLKLLCALPAEIERHGWPRPLLVPPLAQLASYTPDEGARYTAHLDKWEHEKRNQRELTVLCYTNSDWDEAAQGGCLRLHPPAAAAAAIERERLRRQQPGTSDTTREEQLQTSAPSPPSAQPPYLDIAPVAGRIVIFRSSTQLHEVLPCKGSGTERLALTLWIEHAECRSGG